MVFLCVPNVCGHMEGGTLCHPGGRRIEGDSEETLRLKVHSVVHSDGLMAP